MGTKHVLDMLKHVYGPYPEHIILRPEFPRPGVKVVVNDLELNFEGDSNITGFDETEYITTPPKGSRVALNPNVVFFGVIEIESLEWLSEQGLKYLEQDYKDHDLDIHLAHRQSGSSISKVYAQRKPDWPRLKVKICCRKIMLAHYLTSRNDYDKLLIYSQYEQKKRTYWVKSLHVATLKASLKFMARYRLRAMITELVETDPNHTVLEERDINWVIRRYFQTIRPRDKTLRLYADDLDDDHVYAPRHLRHLPRADIRGYLAEHAEWLLAHMIARKQGSANLLNVRQWISFCHEARRDSLEAAKEGVLWGSSQDLDDGPNHLAQRLAQFGETESFWFNQLKAVKRQKPAHTKKPRELSPEALLPQDIPSHTIPKPIQYQYDSDFSEDSSLENYYSESDLPSAARPSPFSSSEIPAFCYDPPQIPSGRFVWTCPGPECSYHIDLMNLQPEHFAALPPSHDAESDDAEALRVLTESSKAWNVTDAPVQRTLFRMVSHHYEVHHLNQGAGLHIHSSGSSGNSRGGADWMVKKATTSIGTTSRRLGSKSKAGTSGPTVKREESSQPLRRSSRIPRPRSRLE